MTPKEKAEQLLDKFSKPFGGHRNIYYKSCALIAVDEIMIHCYQVMKPFWEEVKQEIEKL